MLSEEAISVCDSFVEYLNDNQDIFETLFKRVVQTLNPESLLKADRVLRDHQISNDVRIKKCKCKIMVRMLSTTEINSHLNNATNAYFDCLKSDAEALTKLKTNQNVLVRDSVLRKWKRQIDRHESKEDEGQHDKLGGDSDDDLYSVDGDERPDDRMSIDDNEDQGSEGGCATEAETVSSLSEEDIEIIKPPKTDKRGRNFLDTDDENEKDVEKRLEQVPTTKRIKLEEEKSPEKAKSKPKPKSISSDTESYDSGEASDTDFSEFSFSDGADEEDEDEGDSDIEIVDITGEEGEIIPEDNEVKTTEVLDQQDLDKMLILEKSSDGKPLVYVHKKLTQFLKPHQIEGVKFMYDKVVKQIKYLANPPKRSRIGGCLLAHSMGLGKTLQVITFIHTLMTNPSTTKYFTHVLITVPVNVLINWLAEFHEWVIKPKLPKFSVYFLECDRNQPPVDRLQKFAKNGGVAIIGHRLFQSFAYGYKEKKSPYKQVSLELIQKALIDAPNLVVVDEGHFIKNPKSQLNLGLHELKTKKRIILTGTPLQNNLHEYYTMVNFVCPNLLGTPKTFEQSFVQPIKAGQHSDSTPEDVRTMKRRAHVLYKRLADFVDRKDYSYLAKVLEPKYEYTIKIPLTEIQAKLYKHYLDTHARKFRGAVLPDSHMFRRICLHPYSLFREDKNGKSKKSAKEDIEKQEGNAPEMDPNWFLTVAPEIKKETIDARMSYKIMLLFRILCYCEERKEKLVVFSQSLECLAFIEKLLHMVHRGQDIGLPKEWFAKCQNKWNKNRDYFILDGSVNANNRMSDIKIFNDPKNLTSRLFLISTKAGGIGINLIGANRTIIMDCHFNPSIDLQAVYRTYRFGQTKKVYVYRFVTYGTMEDRIYSRQVIKESLSARIVDEKNIVRHFDSKELELLYQFISPNPVEKPEFVIPKDMMLYEMIQNEETKHLVYSYLEHQNFLEDRPDEGLTQEERDKAWEEYTLEREANHGAYEEEPSEVFENAEEEQLQNSENQFTQVFVDRKVEDQSAERSKPSPAEPTQEKEPPPQPAPKSGPQQKPQPEPSNQNQKENQPKTYGRFQPPPNPSGSTDSKAAEDKKSDTGDGKKKNDINSLPPYSQMALSHLTSFVRNRFGTTPYTDMEMYEQCIGVLNRARSYLSANVNNPPVGVQLRQHQWRSKIELQNLANLIKETQLLQITEKLREDAILNEDKRRHPNRRPVADVCNNPD